MWGLWKRTVRYRSFETARTIERYLATQPVPLGPDGRLIRCDAIDLSIDPVTEEFFLEGLRFAVPLVRDGHGRFVRDPDDGRVDFVTDGPRFRPETAQELLILDEIFRERVYEFRAAGDWLVWDVGANVGFTALWFAGVKGWETVGDELFPVTADAARANVARAGLSDRVEIRTRGIAGSSRSMTLPFDPRARGSNGLFGNHAEDRSDETVPTPVSVVDAAEAVAELVERAAGRPILAKIDCEGAEYEIVERLAETGDLSRLDGVLMEFHLFEPGQSFDRLARPLESAGFVVFGNPNPGVHVGLLRAVRRG